MKPAGELMFLVQINIHGFEHGFSARYWLGVPVNLSVPGIGRGIAQRPKTADYSHNEIYINT